ncbi:RAMP superfamily CRISPR-associated protein [Candidatus Korarchaeum cryptofilum]|jgi:CRISPR-associated protein Cmr6|uniref:CRISPR-associated RAMP protein, Cmr6 family n=1 Tax=Korarchaeum cryptofilum (strain OPF8) TaxID=374847 RepID=B1L414_KORCO|nr:RAMP superfamily CRISPR-associated protein [Candidatus Korarchaeum cryptofilum]ACB07193.1 CRISPR-associated RAMP protein, Cmr6 family [Candidatus Korarchaeum cryptofilum OPF8]
MRLIEEIGKIPLNPSSMNTLSWMRIRGLKYLRDKAERGGESEERRRILEDLFTAYSPDNLNEVFKKASNLLDMQKSALKSCGYDVFDFLAVTRSRLIVGMASEIFGKQIFEVGLSWDPLLNLPYIPGSSLKGAFRSYLESERPDLVPLLGSKSESSSIIFLDSYPVSSKSNLLVPEVTTPIYGAKGVREVKAEPKPVIYPVINKDVTFRMIIGLRGKGRRLGDFLGQFMMEVLRRGIGAKTLVGYGLMEL